MVFEFSKIKNILKCSAEMRPKSLRSLALVHPEITPFPAVTAEVAAVSTNTQLPMVGSKDFSAVSLWPNDHWNWNLSGLLSL